VKATFLSEFEKLYARWLSTPRLNVRPRLKRLSNNSMFPTAEDIFAVWKVYRRNRKDTCRNPKLGSLTAKECKVCKEISPIASTVNKLCLVCVFTVFAFSPFQEDSKNDISSLMFNNNSNRASSRKTVPILQVS